MTPSRTPVETFAAIILWLGLAVDGPSMWGRIERALGLLILTRIREINQAFARLAARLAAGAYPPVTRSSSNSHSRLPPWCWC